MRIAILAIAVSLIGCGGGGGSGNPLAQPSFNSSIQPSYPVPYHTPVKAGYITPMVTLPNDYSWAVMDIHTESLTGQGDNLIVTGFKSQPANATNWTNFNISIFGWENNQFVDQTGSWFAAGENHIVGTHTAKFADLDNNGRLDMVVAPWTDGAIATKHPAYAYFNNPNNSFTRTTIDINIAPSELARVDSKDRIDAHDIAIEDFNNDGYKDIIIGDYGWNTTLALNQGNHSFVSYTQQYRNLPGMSSLAVADFLNNGTKTILAVDQGRAYSNYNEPGLYSWNIDGSNNLNFSLISLGPRPRFELPKWASYNFGGGAPGDAGHNVRVLAYDWNDNGVMDAIVLSRPTRTNNQWPKFSEIQFLKNDGSGNFIDETDNVVVGYNHNTVVSYNPKFVDINGDGLVDILLPTAGDFTYDNNSSQILLKTSDGKYMAAYQNVLTDFTAQANAIAQHPNSGNTLNILQSPDNKSYLVTAVKLSNNQMDNQMAVYLSLVGDNFVNATQAISTIQARWPWMSDATANTLLSQTSKTYLNGHVIDLDRALNPIGGLQIKNLPITGYISGINVNSHSLSVQALDNIGRNFSINVSPSVVDTFSFWSRNYVPNQLTPSSQTEYLIGGSNYEHNNLRFGGHDSNWSIGTPLIPINESVSVSAQMTTLNYNPWIQFSGMWGSVNYSSMFESVITHRKNNWQQQFGYIYTTTNMNPGIITQVDNFHAVWLETGYATEKFGFFTGVRPWIVNGGVNAELPTGIDTQGNLQYTNLHFKINNPVNMYLRTVYTDTITKNIAYKLSGMFVDNGQYRTQLELKYFY